MWKWRNKHGVSRKKIAQMLDRYEYEMSISIVMNSVEPPQKSTQRPPPPQGRQRERVMKKTGYTFCKTKQKRSRKRKKKQNNDSKIVEENSLETLNYVTPGDQDPSQSEEEDLGESGCPLTGDLGNELQDSVSGYKEKSWKYTDPEDSFPNVTSVIELDNTPENHLPKEGDDLFPTFLSMPNQSSATCPTGTQNLSCVTRDDCSDMKVEEPIENRHTLASKIQDLFAETPSSFMQKRERIDKSLPNEPILCHQHGSRALDEASVEEQRVHATQTNYWAFFTTNLSDELQQGSDRQPNFGSWPEGPHKFVCEQRAKKQRSRKQACPDSREQLIKLISTSDGASETLTGDNLPVGNEDLPPPTESVGSFIETETNVFISCSPHLDIPRSALGSTKNKKERQKRIFSLAPNFHILEQCHIDEKQREECDLFTKNHGLKIILGGEKDRISEMNNKEEDKQKIITFDHQPSCFHLDVIKDSPINIGGQFYSHCLSFSRLRDSVYFYKNPVPSLVLYYMVSSWKTPFTNKRPFVTFKSQTRVGDKLKDVGFISSEMLSNQPESLHSLWVTSDLYFLNERFGEKLKIWEESKPLQCLPAEEIQDVANPGFHSLGLPLSQGFAFQLVKLFGSPGVPMESLLPDDYVIPLDWKTLKMIYLQWKASIEKRQKKID
ncbi:NEDD4-binding protein 2-like 2 isoform X3 [Oryctolagus cuniculus]|uniref:NEDD4-binding protein 2-like 2 isoform X3 n=1 Tax=Oryctolagus cuniculus TaxID=9986 RepID=UPI00222FF952|nr:NEDD4-binding protein 2-like 2 isoform X4 [Oryctolagus cuniculus]XP_051687790.1 NEDD4-binding protein 2-like 2 isoform X4 [Oryctolagus cuniculus]